MGESCIRGRYLQLCAESQSYEDGISLCIKSSMEWMEFIASIPCFSSHSTCALHITGVPMSAAAKDAAKQLGVSRKELYDTAMQVRISEAEV